MEFPHLLRLIQETQFDTIYHEHFSYLSLVSVEQVFAAHGLRLYDVEELRSHGGSLRIYACHEGAAHETSERLVELRGREESAGLRELETYVSFGERVPGPEAGAARVPAPGESGTGSRSPATARRRRA